MRTRRGSVPSEGASLPQLAAESCVAAMSPDTGCVQKGAAAVYFNRSLPQARFWGQYAAWERDTFRVVSRLVGAESTVLDIGGWIGPTSLWFAHVAKYTVALEPTSAAFAELSANLAVNRPHLPRGSSIELVNAGMSHTAGEANMSNRGDSMDRLELERRRRRLQEEARAPAKAAPAKAAKAALRASVRLVTIADLEARYPQLAHTTFVKVDTEGFERHIVPALGAWLGKRKPTLFLSLHPIFTSQANLLRVMAVVRQTFPFVYECDMVTRFRYQYHSSTGFRGAAHRGVDVVASFKALM